MIKAAVPIDSNMPNWAENFLNDAGLLVYLRIMKKSKRSEGLAVLLKATGKTELSQQLYCNAKGDVVFQWVSAKSKTMFLLKWA